jgi:SAM-dependent methyltransferase
MYAVDPDPWGFADRWYEQRKYALTLAALTRQRYRSVFEPGCSIGVLTAQLALRCDRLLAVDLVDTAVQNARRAVGDLPDGSAEVVVERWDAHEDWPTETFDLIVVSEMLYYLDPPDARRFMDQAAGHLDADGELLLVHWRERVPEYPMTGDEAHALAIATRGLDVQASYEDDDLVLHLLAPTGATSTAHREGLRSGSSE